MFTIGAPPLQGNEVLYYEIKEKHGGGGGYWQKQWSDAPTPGGVWEREVVTTDPQELTVLKIDPSWLDPKSLRLRLTKGWGSNEETIAEFPIALGKPVSIQPGVENVYLSARRRPEGYKSPASSRASGSMWPWIGVGVLGAAIAWYFLG